MTKLPEEMFDVRKLERFLHEGTLTSEQVDQHLAGLEDCADNTEVSTIHMLTHHVGRRVVSSESEEHEEEEG